MLKVGDPIPEICLPDQNGDLICLGDFKGKQALVVFFYPKDNTPGCTTEVCEFRDQYTEFMDLGASVFGISSDSIQSHKNVIEKRRLPYSLLSDIDHAAEKAFKVKRNLLGLLPGRVTFVVDVDGKIINIFSSATNPKKHISIALESLKESC